MEGRSESESRVEDGSHWRDRKVEGSLGWRSRVGDEENPLVRGRRGEWRVVRLLCKLYAREGAKMQDGQ